MVKNGTFSQQISNDYFSWILGALKVEIFGEKLKNRKPTTIALLLLQREEEVKEKNCCETLTDNNHLPKFNSKTPFFSYFHPKKK